MKTNELPIYLSMNGLSPESFGIKDLSVITSIPGLADGIVAYLGGPSFIAGDFAHDPSASDADFAAWVNDVKQTIANPTKYVSSYFNQLSYITGYNNRNFGGAYNDPVELKNTAQYLNSRGVSPSTLQKDYSTNYQQGASQSNVAVHGDDGFLSSVLPLAAAYFLPSAGAEIASALGIGTTAGTAIASAAYQASQGVDIETAIKNATVNAVTQTGSQDVAKEISGAVGKVGADAIASAGGSIASTLAKGGSAQDAIKNAGASIAASLTSSELGRATGAAVGGAITGGTTGAVLGAAGELGKPTPTDKGTQVASASDVLKEPGVVSDTPTTDLGEITVTAPRDNVQVVSPTPTPTPAPPTPTPTTTTDLGEITVTAPKDKTQVISPDAPAKEATKAEEPPKETAKATTYDPSLFIYSSKEPLSQALRLDMQAPKTAQTAAPGSEALSQALRIGDPGEPLFGGKKKGKKSGWNVESLRYMGQES